jgi:hypothetical protein
MTLAWRVVSVRESRHRNQPTEFTMSKPFKISAHWIDYAHGPGAEDSQPMALRLTDAPCTKGANPLISVTDAALVAEIADVAELYIGDGNEMSATAKRAFNRAVAWLKTEGVADWRAMLRAAHKAEEKEC